MHVGVVSFKAGWWLVHYSSRPSARDCVGQANIELGRETRPEKTPPVASHVSFIFIVCASVDES